MQTIKSRTQNERKNGRRAIGSAMEGIRPEVAAEICAQAQNDRISFENEWVQARNYRRMAGFGAFLTKFHKSSIVAPYAFGVGIFALRMQNRPVVVEHVWLQGVLGK